MRIRLLFSEHLKSRVRGDRRPQGELAALVGLNCTAFSWFMHDRASIGPLNRAKVAALGKLLSVPESKCFREQPDV